MGKKKTETQAKPASGKDAGGKSAGSAKGGKGGKSVKADDEEKDTKVKGAQSINVRHILVREEPSGGLP